MARRATSSGTGSAQPGAYSINLVVNTQVQGNYETNLPKQMESELRSIEMYSKELPNLIRQLGSAGNAVQDISKGLTATARNFKGTGTRGESSATGIITEHMYRLAGNLAPFGRGKFNDADVRRLQTTLSGKVQDTLFRSLDRMPTATIKDVQEFSAAAMKQRVADLFNIQEVKKIGGKYQVIGALKTRGVSVNNRGDVLFANRLASSTSTKLGDVFTLGKKQAILTPRSPIIAPGRGRGGDALLDEENPTVRTLSGRAARAQTIQRNLPADFQKQWATYQNNTLSPARKQQITTLYRASAQHIDEIGRNVLTAAQFEKRRIEEEAAGSKLNTERSRGQYNAAVRARQADKKAARDTEAQERRFDQKNSRDRAAYDKEQADIRSTGGIGSTPGLRAQYRREQAETARREYSARVQREQLMGRLSASDIPRSDQLLAQRYINPAMLPNALNQVERGANLSPFLRSAQRMESNLQRSGLGQNNINQIIQNSGSTLLRRGDLEPNDNTLGRTAVAFSLLYGMGSGVSSAYSNAQAGNIVSNRLGYISPLIGQNSSAGRYNYRQGAFGLGLQTGTSYLDQLKGFETIQESGDNLSTQDVIRIQKKASELSSVTGQDQDAITNILMSGINAFKLKGNDIDKFANALYSARTKGVIEFKQMQTSLGKVFQSGKQAGFSGFDGPQGLGALLAMTAASTREGGAPAQNATAVASFLSTFSKPKKLAALNKMGISGSTSEMIQQVLSRENAKPGFLTGSGIFDATRGARGGSVLASELSTYNDLLKDITGNVDKLSTTFDEKMQTPEKRMARLSELGEQLKDALGQDTIKAVDDLTRPLGEIVNLTTKIQQGKMVQHPAAGAIYKGFAGGAEFGTLLGALNLAGMAGSTLLNTGIRGIEVPGNASFGTRAGAGVMNLFGSLGGLGNTVLGQGAGAIKSEQALLSETLKKNPNLGFMNTIGLGANPLSGGGKFTVLPTNPNPMFATLLAGAAAQWMYQSAFEGYKNTVVQRNASFQTNIENAQTGLDSISGLRSAVGTLRGQVKSGDLTPQQGATQLFSVLGQQSDAFDKLRKDYDVQIDQANKVVRINGLVKSSFEDITKSIMDLASSDMNRNIKRIMDNMNMIQAGEDSIRGANISEHAFDPSMVLGSLIQGGVLGNIWSKKGQSKWLDWYQGATGNTAIQQQGDLRLQQFGQQAKELWANNPSNPNSGENEANKKLQDIQDARQKIKDKLDNELKSIDIQAGLEQELGDLTDKESKLKTDKLKSETVIKGWTELIENGTKNWADFTSWLKDQTPEFKKEIQDSIQYQHEIAENLRLYNDSIQAVTKSFEAFDKTQEQAQHILDTFTTVQEAKQNYNSTKLGVYESLSEVGNSAYSDRVRPLAQALTKSKFQQIELGMNLKNFNATASLNATKSNYIDKVLAYQDQIKGNPNFVGPMQRADLQSLVSNFETKTQSMDYTQKTQVQGYDEYLDSKAKLDALSTSGAELRQQKRQLGQENINSFDAVGGSLLNMIQGIGPIVDTYRNTVFKPEDLPQLKTLAQSPMANNPFFRNTQEYLTKMLAPWKDKDGKLSAIAQGSPTVSAIDSFNEMLKSTGIKDFGEISNLKPGDSRWGAIQEGILNLSQNISGTKNPILESANIADAFSKLTDQSKDLSTGLVNFDMTLQDVINNLKIIYAKLGGNVGDIKDALTFNQNTANNTPVLPPSGTTVTGTLGTMNPQQLLVTPGAAAGGAWTPGTPLPLPSNGSGTNISGSTAGNNQTTSVLGAATIVAAGNYLFDKDFYNQLKQNRNFKDNCAAIVNGYLQKAVKDTTGKDVPFMKSATDQEAWFKAHATELGLKYVNYGSANPPSGAVGMFGTGGKVAHTALYKEFSGGKSRWLENQGFNDSRSNKLPLMYSWGLERAGAPVGAMDDFDTATNKYKKDRDSWKIKIQNKHIQRYQDLQEKYGQDASYDPLDPGWGWLHGTHESIFDTNFMSNPNYLPNSNANGANQFVQAGQLIQQAGAMIIGASAQGSVGGMANSVAAGISRSQFDDLPFPYSADAFITHSTGYEPTTVPITSNRKTRQKYVYGHIPKRLLAPGESGKYIKGMVSNYQFSNGGSGGGGGSSSGGGGLVNGVPIGGGTNSDWTGKPLVYYGTDANGVAYVQCPNCPEGDVVPLSSITASGGTESGSTDYHDIQGLTPQPDYWNNNGGGNLSGSVKGGISDMASPFNGTDAQSFLGGNIQVDNGSPSPGPAANATPKKPGFDSLFGNVLAGGAGAGIGAYFSALQQGATGKDAIKAAEQSFTGNFSSGMGSLVSNEVGGVAGMILGPLAGGLIGWGLSKIFKLGKKPPQDRPQVSAWIENPASAFQANVLPTSAYATPIHGNELQQMVQYKSQVFHFPDSPQFQQKVASAINEDVMNQWKRGPV